MFARQGINATGMDQLATVAQVSSRTLYVHFPRKTLLVEAYLRQFDTDPLPQEAVLADTGRPPRERLLGIFDPVETSPPGPRRGCLYLNAAVEVAEPSHAVHELVAAHKRDFALRIADVARAAGAADPETLGEQLALVYDGAAARSVVLNSPKAAAHAREIASRLIDAALPTEV